MNFYSPSDIKTLLSKHGAKTSKRLGQNFLINRGVLEKIIQAANLSSADTALEIGPGLGVLTQELAKRAKKVIAIEKDRKFVEILRETMKEFKNVEIIEGDVLRIENIPPFKKGGLGGILPKKDKSTPVLPESSSGQALYKRRELKYKLVANLPYYITSPVIRKFLEEKNQPKEMILMVQKEVAQRICACPPSLRSGASRRAKPPRLRSPQASYGGQAKMSLLAVSVQFYAEPKIISYVSKGSFWPQPKVDSAILRLTPKARLIPGLHQDDTDVICVSASGLPKPEGRRRAFRVLFFQIVRAGFSAPRKQLLGNLSKGLKIERYIIEEALKNAEISPAQRAETLRVEDWIKIVKYLISNKILNT